MWPFRQKTLHPVGAVDRVGEEADRLDEPFIGFGAAKAEEAAARRPKTFTPQAGDAEPIIRGFEEKEG